MSPGFRSPRRIARRFRHLPGIVRTFRSWQRFMLHYAWGSVSPRPYVLRSGACIQLGRAVEHAAVLEVFLARDYGTVPAGATVIDIGANIGAFTVYALTSAPDVVVHAYEPSSEAFALLRLNVAANRGGGRVDCHQQAVAGDAGRRPLYPGGGRFFFPTLVDGPSRAVGEGREVECVTLSEILGPSGLPRVDLLKLDCEGSEYEILYRSQSDALAPVTEIRMEYHQLDGGERNGSALAGFLADRGFRISRLTADATGGGVLWAVRTDAAQTTLMGGDEVAV